MPESKTTLTLGENDEPRSRWKYQGDVQEIAKDEHEANIPLPHLTNGCEFEVVPREQMDNLIKFIDGSEPGELPHVMLAVDQNDQRSEYGQFEQYISTRP